jgi:hypothetical protein
MSRQREWQKRMAEQGRCQWCADPAVRAGYCQIHYEKRREQWRARYYAKKAEKETREETIARVWKTLDDEEKLLSTLFHKVNVSSGLPPAYIIQFMREMLHTREKWKLIY